MVYRVNRDPIIDGDRVLRVDRMRVGSFAQTSPQAQGSTSGYISGGYAGTNIQNTIDKFPFSVDANATDVGDLSQTRSLLSGQSSTENGYTSGGTIPTGPPYFSNVIDKFPFSVDANATDVGDLITSTYNSTGQSSTANGYVSGGQIPTPVNTIVKFPFSVDANATDVGDLTVARGSVAGNSSRENGYTTGGYNFPQNFNTIDKFPFSVDANATDVGDLTSGQSSSGNQSSDINGYSSGGGGSFGTLTNIIQKFPFASDANATDVGDLTATKSQTNGQSSTENGYNSTGFPDTNVIEKFPFSADANSADVGDATQARSRATGQQV